MAISVTSSSVFLMAIFVWTMLKIFRQYLVSSPLDVIQGPRRHSFWLGNMAVLFGTEAWELHDQLRAYGSVTRIHGVLGSRALFTSDPKAMQHMLVKDQRTFGEASWFLAYNMIFYGPGLLSVEGNRHRKQRKILNPAFSVAQMRRITGTLYSIAHLLQETIRSQIEDTRQEIDVLHWLSCSALESIGRGGLGYSFDVFQEGKENKFAQALKSFAPAVTNFSALGPIVQYFEKNYDGLYTYISLAPTFRTRSSYATTTV